jgi:streptomycin 3"-adenylyltransferase
MGDWLGDERNVLLTLARMIVTVEAGEVVPKDEAARRVFQVSMASGSRCWRWRLLPMRAGRGTPARDGTTLASWPTS